MANSSSKTVLVQTRLSRAVGRCVQRRAAAEGRSVASWVRQLILRELAGDVEAVRRAMTARVDLNPSGAKLPKEESVLSSVGPHDK